MKITLADVVKILMVIATLLSAVAGVIGTIRPTWGLIAGGVSAAILAFVNKVGTPSPSTPVDEIEG